MTTSKAIEILKNGKFYEYISEDIPDEDLKQMHDAVDAAIDALTAFSAAETVESATEVA